jgi:hypothetical protein
VTSKSKSQSPKLSSAILNYFAAFTETRFNFRTLINYRWTGNELTLDLSISQDFQDQLIARIRSGDHSPIVINSNEHVLKLSGDKVFLAISKELSERFGLDYLKGCLEVEFQKVADKNQVFVSGEDGLRPAEGSNLSPLEVEKQNQVAFLEGCRKYNLALRRQIEHILLDLQQQEVSRLKEETGLEDVPASTFNSSNYLKGHFDSLQAKARDSKSVEEYLDKVKGHFSNGVEDIILYDLFIALQKYARFNVVGTTYLFFHELHRNAENGSSEGYPVFFVEVTLIPEVNEVKVLFPRDLLLINTPAVNYFKFPSVLTTSRASTFKDATSNLGGMEIFLQTHYGLDKPFVLESRFGTIKPPEDSLPDIRCRIGFHVVRDENKKLLDYSEIMSRLQAGETSKFVDFISDYVDGNVENTQDETDTDFNKRYPVKSAKRYISDNPLNLNTYQKRILLALNNPKNRIVVVDGPPGTGKSHTIAAITYWANRERKSVLLTSHKKQALDVIDRILTDKFRNLHPKAKPSVIRLSRNGKSLNTLENSLQNAVINAAADRANSFNEEALEKDEKRLVEAAAQSIEKRLSSGEGYADGMKSLLGFEQLRKSLVEDGVFQEDESNLPKVSVPIDFEKVMGFASEDSVHHLKDVSLPSLRFLFDRKDDIPDFLAACEEVNVYSKDTVDCSVGLNEIPESFTDLIQEASALFRKNVPISSLQSGHVQGAFLKRILRKLPPQSELDALLKSMRSLKYGTILEEIARIKKITINQLTLGMAAEGALELRSLLSLKKHKDIIDQYREVSGKVDQSVSEIYQAVMRVKDGLEMVNDEVLASIENLFRSYGRILAKLHVSEMNLDTLALLGRLTGQEAKIWRWVQLHFVLSRTMSLETLHDEDLDSLCRLNQKQVEYQNDLRLKNLNNYLGEMARIKVCIDGGRRLTQEQASVLLKNVSALIAEPELISRHFPMEENLIDLLIIDEASQVSIAESISLILRAKQVVVFGDEYQYGAVGAYNVNSKYSAGYFKDIINAYTGAYGVASSDQERESLIHEVSKEISEDDQEVEQVLRPQDNAGAILWLKTFNIRTSTLSFAKAIANYTTSLREHFRSFPEIIDYSNEFFYKPAQLELSINRIRTKPIGEVLQFIQVETKGNSGNNVNLDEIDAVIEDLDKRIKNGFKGTVGIITSFKEQQARMEQALNEKMNLPSLRKNHDLAVWFVGDVQGEERDLVYYSLVEDEKFGNGDLRSIYPVLGGTADSIRSLKMQRLNVGFSRAKDTMVFVHSMLFEKYAKTRLGDALKHYDKVLAECRKSDFFVEDPSIFESPAERDLYALLINTKFVKANREHVRIIPQFKIGEYLQAEFARHIPKYRVDFLMTFSKGGKEQTLILEYDGVEYHTKNPDIVTKHTFSQQYLDYDVGRQLELESYGYRFLRLNKFTLQPEQQKESRVDVLDRLLRKTFAV